jgi:hypothetical protein
VATLANQIYHGPVSLAHLNVVQPQIDQHQAMNWSIADPGPAGGALGDGNSA